MKTIPWLIAFAAIMACLFLANREHRARQELSELKAASLTQTKLLTESHTRVTELTQKYAEAASALKAAKAGGGGAEDGGPAAGDKAKTVSLTMHDIIRDHPEMAEIFRKQVRRSVIQQYGNLFNSLDLSPEKSAKLKDLLVELTVSPIDAATAAAGLGVPADSPEMRTAQNQARRDVESEIKALVGPETAGMFNGNTGYLLQTGMSDMTDAGQALSSDQIKAMAQITAEAADPEKNPSMRQRSAYEPDAETGLTGVQQRILQRANATLSPDQIAILRNAWLQQNQQQAIMKQAAGGNGNWSLSWR